MQQNQYDQPKTIYFSSYDTDFDTADGTVTLDVKGTLLRNSVQGYINNSTSHNLIIKFSEDGTNYGQNILVLGNTQFDCKSISIAKIQLTATQNNSAYEIFLT